MQDAVVTMDTMLSSMPVKEMARVQIDISYSLSLFSPVEKFYLGTIREDKQDLRSGGSRSRGDFILMTSVSRLSC